MWKKRRNNLQSIRMNNSGMRKWIESRVESGFFNEKYDIRRLFDKTDFIKDLK